MEEIKNTEAEVLSEELCEETGNNPTVETAEQTDAAAPTEEQAAAEKTPKTPKVPRDRYLPLSRR